MIFPVLSLIATKPFPGMIILVIVSRSPGGTVWLISIFASPENLIGLSIMVLVEGWFVPKGGGVVFCFCDNKNIPTTMAATPKMIKASCCFFIVINYNKNRPNIHWGDCSFLLSSFDGRWFGLFNLLGRLNAGGADQNLVAINAARLKIDILPALGGNVRVAARNARHVSAFAVGALSGHRITSYWLRDVSDVKGRYQKSRFLARPPFPASSLSYFGFTLRITQKNVL